MPESEVYQVARAQAAAEQRRVEEGEEQDGESSRSWRSRSRSPSHSEGQGGYRGGRGGRGRGRGGRGGGRAGGRAGRAQQQDGAGNQHMEYEGGTTTGTEDDGSVASEQIEEDQNFSTREQKAARKREMEEGVRATIPVDLLWQVMPVAVKEKLSTRQLIMIISAVLIRCDVPLEKFSIGLDTAHRYKKNCVQKIGSDALEVLAEEAKRGDFPILAHFDEKILTHDFEGKKESVGRMVTTLTSPYLEHDQLVNAAAMEDGTGFQSASEVYMGLAGLDIMDQVIGAVADTTSSNFGQEEGAMQHLQRMMDKPILEIPCTHHTEELPAKDVQEAVSGRKSSGPTDPLFVKWSNAWNTVKDAFEENMDFEFNKFNWEEKKGTVTEAIAKMVLEWARKAKKDKKFSRGDYNDALNYLLAFGGVPVDFNMARPCRVSKARFLQLALYYLQMYLLLDLPEVRELLTAEEVQEVLVMGEYCALHYIPWMLQAKFAAR